MTTKQCPQCRRGFDTRHHDAEYCSRDCFAKARAQAEDKRIELALSRDPRNDGQRRDPYIATCALCSREQAEYFLTRESLKLMRPLPPCSTCRGFVTLMPLFSCSVLAPTKAAPIRTVASPVRPVPRRVA